jgi:hypothetical protein
MKCTGIILAFLLFAFPACAAADTLIKEIPSLRVVAEEVSPEPVEPGQDLTVKIRVYSDYVYGVPAYSNASGDDARVSLDVKYPFHLKSGSRDDEPDICTGCSKDYTYYLVVDAGAVSGTYPLTVKITRGALEREYDISVKVTGIPDVVYDASPPSSPANAGGGYVIQTVFRNIGTGTARNIKVSSPSEKFVILGSGLKVIDSLAPGAGTLLPLSFDVDESVKSGSYSIPLLVSFIDEKGMGYSLTSQVGVKVVNPAKLGIESLKTSPDGSFIAGEPVQASLRIQNMGKGDADNVRAVMTLPDGSSVVSYLGKLKPDEDAPAVFSFTPDYAGNYSYKIAVQYEDGYGIHASEESLAARVREKDKGNTPYIAAAAVLLVVLAVAVRLARKK